GADGYSHTRRRHRAGSHRLRKRGHRRSRRRDRVGNSRGRRGRHGSGGNAASGVRARVHPAQQGRHQGAPDHPGRYGLPLGKRGAAQGARPLRQHPPQPEPAGRRDAAREHRPHHLPGEHRRPVRRCRAHGRQARGGVDQDHHPRGHGADLPHGLRALKGAGPQAHHGDPQGEHHEVHRRPVPRRLFRGR
ncbi:MAG: Isocitrate dehydrogenase [NAD], partial [uncultured Rubrobacteraceae bacterium]